MGRFFRRSPSGRSGAPVDDEVGQAILQRWRRGDESAFGDLFREYRQLVYGVLHHLLGSDPELEDVVQNAFLEVFRSLGGFEGRSRLSSWIARVALHTGYHHLRRRKSRPTDYEAVVLDRELPDSSAIGDPERAAAGNEAAARVHSILETIPKRKRTVFVLNDLQGLPQEEIAEIVGANIATVRTRLFYARREFWKKAKNDPVLAGLAPQGAPKGSGKGS